MKRFLFRKNQRLRSNEQFKAVLKRKCSAGNALVKLYIAANTCGYPRLGLSVSKVCGNSVTRNRLKRLTREVFRLEQHNIPSSYDYLLIFSPKMSKKAKLDELMRARSAAFEQIRVSFLELVTCCIRKERQFADN